MPSCLYQLSQLKSLYAEADETLTGLWPLQDIVLLLYVCARINRPFFLPARLHCPYCFNTIARLLLHVYWAIYNPPPEPLVYAIHHTTLAIAISVKDQPGLDAFVSHPNTPYDDA